jgi:Zn finger protein HypA/HybF involved in hydrogenase expression
MRKYRNYSDEDVIKFAAQAQSMGQLLDMLELRKAGGNYA